MEKNLTQGSIKKLYFRYLGAAFGSSMISCIYGMVDVAVVGQYQGPQTIMRRDFQPLRLCAADASIFSENCILCLGLTWVCLVRALRPRLA